MKAANWLADTVRRDVNPAFFAVAGRFLLTLGPDATLGFETHVFEYTPEEKTAQPAMAEALVQRLQEHLR